jgi:hypothetical protein
MSESTETPDGGNTEMLIAEEAAKKEMEKAKEAMEGAATARKDEMQTDEGKAKLKVLEDEKTILVTARNEWQTAEANVKSAEKAKLPESTGTEAEALKEAKTKLLTARKEWQTAESKVNLAEGKTKLALLGLVLDQQILTAKGCMEEAKTKLDEAKLRKNKAKSYNPAGKKIKKKKKGGKALQSESECPEQLKKFYNQKLCDYRKLQEERKLLRKQANETDFEYDYLIACRKYNEIKKLNVYRLQYSLHVKSLTLEQATSIEKYAAAYYQSAVYCYTIPSIVTTSLLTILPALWPAEVSPVLKSAMLGSLGAFATLITSLLALFKYQEKAGGLAIGASMLGALQVLCDSALRPPYADDSKLLITAIDEVNKKLKEIDAATPVLPPFLVKQATEELAKSEKDCNWRYKEITKKYYRLLTEVYEQRVDDDSPNVQPPAAYLDIAFEKTLAWKFNWEEKAQQPDQEERTRWCCWTFQGRFDCTCCPQKVVNKVTPDSDDEDDEEAGKQDDQNASLVNSLTPPAAD